MVMIIPLWSVFSIINLLLQNSFATFQGLLTL